MRGLESLIPQKKSKYAEDLNEKESVFLIDVDKIKPNPYQPRREFNREELKSLADSIKIYGVLQPLIVSKVERDVPRGRQVTYELIAGERRLRAAKLIHMRSVPVIVRHGITDTQKLEVSLIENLQRDDLSALEEARAFKQLQDKFGMSQADIARRVSKSRPYVANTVRILGLPKNIQEALSVGRINEGHTRPLLSLNSTNEQSKLFKEIVDRRFTVREAEERARQLSKGINIKKVGAHAGGRALVDAELKELIEQFKDKASFSDVRVKTKGRTANLALYFSSKKDLSDWIRSFIS